MTLLFTQALTELSTMAGLFSLVMSSIFIMPIGRFVVELIPGCDHKPALMWAYKAADKDAASSRGGSSRSCCTIGWHFSDRFEAIDKDLLGAEPHPAGRRWQRRRRRRIGRWRPAPPAELPSECLSAGVWLVAGDKFEAISTRTTTGG